MSMFSVSARGYVDAFLLKPRAEPMRCWLGQIEPPPDLDLARDAIGKEALSATLRFLGWIGPTAFCRRTRICKVATAVPQMTRQRGAPITQASQDFGLDHTAHQAQSRIAF
jgi:hypothetical protein